MPLILGLLTYFAGGFVVGLAYHLGYRKRALAESLHMAAVFGLFVTLVVFVAAVVQGMLSGAPAAA